MGQVGEAMGEIERRHGDRNGAHCCDQYGIGAFQDRRDDEGDQDHHAQSEPDQRRQTAQSPQPDHRKGEQNGETQQQPPTLPVGELILEGRFGFREIVHDDSVPDVECRRAGEVLELLCGDAAGCRALEQLEHDQRALGVGRIGTAAVDDVGDLRPVDLAGEAEELAVDVELRPRPQRGQAHDHDQAEDERCPRQPDRPAIGSEQPLDVRMVLLGHTSHVTVVLMSFDVHDLRQRFPAIRDRMPCSSMARPVPRSPTW